MDIDRFLLVKPLELLILTVLAAGDRHGYGIRQDILDQTDRALDVEAGSLYRHIRALEDDGLVTEAQPPKREMDERRIYYRLTPLGRRVLAAEMTRLRALVRAAERKGILTPERA
jgi:PadR family transcriptional regulator